MSRTLQNGLELSAAEKRRLLADLLRQKAARPRVAPTSFAQQRLWFLSQLEPDSFAYNISRQFRLSGELNVPALRRSFSTIVARHDVLRGSFDLVDGHPVQLIAPRFEIELPVVDLANWSEDERAAEVSRLAIEDAQKPFRLTQAPLFRVCLLKLDHTDHVLLLTMHHIVSDGWSMGIFVREMAAIYQGLIAGTPAQLPELPIQYPDFARWQREWLHGEVLEEQLRYWTGHLAGAPAALNLPVAKPRPAMQTTRGSHITKALSPEVSAALTDLSRGEGVTLFMTLLAAFETLLFRYSGQEDLVIGSPIAGRNRAETEELIGFFVNTLPLRTRLSGNPTFRELLKRVRETALGAYAHQDLPFEKIVEWAQPERSLSYAPIFQVMFALQNQPRATFALPGLELSPLKRESDAAKFDLTLFVTETDEGLECWLEYNTDLFSESTVARLLEHYEVLLKGIVNNPNLTIAELPLLTEVERQQLLVEWNDTHVEFSTTHCVHQLFETQAEESPEAIALVCEDEQLSYRELNARANQLAHYLRRLGVRPEDRVALCLERSTDMVVAVLATLKAGGAYVPLDPAYPAERLAFTLQDAGAGVLLTQENLSALLPETKARVVCLDSEREAIAAEDESNPTSVAGPGNLAYVIYTSGSTGRPKGVQISHRALSNFLNSMRRQPGISSDDVLLSVTTLSFDIAGLEIYLPLIAGARVVLATREVAADGVQLAEALSISGATIMQATPATWHLLIESGWQGNQRLRVFCGGETLSRELAAQLLSRGAEVWNLYGPTETTIWSTMCRVEDSAVQIGRPIANTRVFILDDHLRMVPLGVAGELYIGGDGLARGYLNRPELSAEHFIPDPFSRLPGARLYKTGDLARYLPTGSIEVIGRIDHQVKLRGYRIEPGEIETVLREQEEVDDAVVAVWESAGGNRDLVAYVVVAVENQHDDLLAQLKNALKNRLPSYMLPAHFVLLEQFPLTPNGKLDRGALPAPDRSRSEAAPTRVAPRDATEEQLAGIWKTVLEIDAVGVNDNFFELGGHSLLAVRLMSEIEKVFNQKIPLVSLFQNATIATLADLLRQDVASLTWPTVIEIQREGLRTPLFCVSTPNVNALGYRSLARHLGPDQPVYGLQAQYPEDLDGEHSPAAVDELATEYMKAMRKLQPRGPYQFVGLCRGAHIAFEIARRLELAGEHVGFVGILDTWVLENTYNRFLFVEYYFRRVSSMLRLSLGEQFGFLKKRLQTTGRQSRRPVENPASESSAKRCRNPVIDVYFPGPDFVPRTFSGRVSVFRARKQPLNRIRDKELGWGRLAEGGVDLHYVPGTHGASVLQEPNVEVLAAEINKCLVDAEMSDEL